MPPGHISPPRLPHTSCSRNEGSHSSLQGLPDCDQIAHPASPSKCRYKEKWWNGEAPSSSSCRPNMTHRRTRRPSDGAEAPSSQSRPDNLFTATRTQGTTQEPRNTGSNGQWHLPPSPGTRGRSGQARISFPAQRILLRLRRAAQAEW